MLLCFRRGAVVCTNSPLVVGGLLKLVLCRLSPVLSVTKVHFKAPATERLEREMEVLLAWLSGEDNTDPVIRAGIPHDPFENGNKRIARAIGDMALARADGTPDRFYSLSSQIEAESAAVLRSA